MKTENDAYPKRNHIGASGTVHALSDLLAASGETYLRNAFQRPVSDSSSWSVSCAAHGESMRQASSCEFGPYSINLELPSTGFWFQSHELDGSWD